VTNPPPPADIHPVGRFIGGQWTTTGWYVRASRRDGWRVDVRRFNNVEAAQAYVEFYNRLLPTK
jgi:hypothetical protein